MKAIQILERTLEIFSNINNLIPMDMVSKLQSDIELFLDNYYRNSSINETEYEELDDRLKVLEGFLDTIETIASKDYKNLS